MSRQILSSCFIAVLTLVATCSMAVAEGEEGQRQKKSGKGKEAVASKSDAVRAATTFRTSKLEGLNVRNLKGEEIGEVKELVVDLEKQEIKYAALSFGGFLGIGDKLFAVPMDALTLKYDQDETYFLLDIDKKTLENAPGFSQNTWPDVGNPRWAADVDKYYGRVSKSQKPKAVYGTLVTVNEDRLALKDQSGQRSEYPLSENVSITLDGDSADTDELKENHHLFVTVESREGKPVVTQIQASSKKRGSASDKEKHGQAGAKTITGTVTSADEGKLTITDSEGNTRSIHVAEDAKVHVEGETAKIGDLKEGQKVKVHVRERNGKTQAIRISARPDRQ